MGFQPLRLVFGSLNPTSQAKTSQRAASHGLAAAQLAGGVGQGPRIARDRVQAALRAVCDVVGADVEGSRVDRLAGQQLAAARDAPPKASQGLKHLKTLGFSSKAARNRSF